MRKLTVKNFSVIKEAELEFGKITVLIGPQSSGKSLLCKLAYFLGKELVELAVTSVANRDGWNAYIEFAAREFSQRFTNYSVGDWIGIPHRVTYTSFRYQVTLRWTDDSNLLSFEFSDAFREQYHRLLDDLYGNPPSASGAFYPGGLNPSLRRWDSWAAFNKVLFDTILEQTVYAPAGRAFFTNTSKGFALLQNLGIDATTREFAAQIQWDGRWKVGLLTTGRGITDEINRNMTDIVKGFVTVDAGVPRFLTSDGHKLPLEMVSTGVQELVPLFNVLEQLMYLREHNFELSKANYNPPRLGRPEESRPLLFLEEPEANVFPKTQYELVQLFAWLASDPILDFSWVITTHSPYIMTAFNTLIEAGRVGSHPDKRDKVDAVISERYWIDEKQFKAYGIQDKKVISIFETEAENPEGQGMIDGDYLDGVSDQLGKEFDRLLDIEYAS